MQLALSLAITRKKPNPTVVASNALELEGDQTGTIDLEGDQTGKITPEGDQA